MKKKVLIGEACVKNVRIREYTHVRGYHACRPENVGDYYLNGLLPSDPVILIKQAAVLFGLPEDRILSIKPSFTATTINKIYFAFYKSIFLEGLPGGGSGHYLCWGSEFLAGVAAELDLAAYGRCHDILEKTGIPTIFTCDIPIELIPDFWLEGIAKANSSYNNDVSFAISSRLPPACIVSHEHPKRIFNPVQWRYFVNDRTICPFCMSS